MATLLGSTTQPTYGDRYQGYPYDNKYALQLTLPSGGPYRVVTLGAWLAGDTTHFASVPTCYLMAWDNSTGALLGQSASFVPTGRAFGTQDKYEKAVSTPFVVAGGTTIKVGFGFVTGGSKGVQWPTNNANQINSTNQTVPGTFSSPYNSAGKLQAWLYYELANTAPNAPVWSAPTSGEVITTATPTLAFTGSDPDAGDTMLNYDLQVDNNSDFSSPVWDVSASTTGATGWSVSRAYGGTALVRGTTYFARARCRDQDSAVSAWSATRSFTYNALPVASVTSPTNGGVAATQSDWGDPASISFPDIGEGPFLQFTVTATDALGEQIDAFEVDFAADSGGSPASFITHYLGAFEGGAFFLASGGSYTSYFGQDPPLLASRGIVVAGDNATSGTYLHIRARAKDATGEWGSWSSWSRFRLVWSEGIYEYNVGASAVNPSFTAGAKTGNVHILFRAADTSGGDAATGKTAWVTDIADVPAAEYLQVLVRLGPDTSGTEGTLASMTLTYQANATVPDGWTAA
jgi:hypothetical protein